MVEYHLVKLLALLHSDELGTEGFSTTYRYYIMLQPQSLSIYFTVTTAKSFAYTVTMKKKNGCGKSCAGKKQ